MKNETAARWIWYTGDFEIYHSMLLHDRREQNGYDYPCMWRSAHPENNVRFRTDVELPEASAFSVKLRGKGYVRVDGVHYIPGAEIPVSAGKHTIIIEASYLEKFPAVYVDSAYIRSGADWTADRYDGVWLPVGSEPVFTSPADDPGVFPFSYREIRPVSAVPADGGILYDFGVESFGPVTVSHTSASGAVLVSYGESRTEALDPANAIITETVPADVLHAKLRPRAFRYLFVRAENGGEPEIGAQLEYLPIEDKASFSCDDPQIAKIWEICVRTFHLNSREFYLDGIKRDRWCWSGDAYQSYMVNRYLYAEPSIIRRTIRALFGKRPAIGHVNTINDYSAYLIIAVWEYYFATGDKAFVETVWADICDLYGFIVSRLDRDTGYVVQRPGDWIFIDWADIDKNGPLCAEQILLWQTHLVMAKLSALLGLPSAAYEETASSLRASILRDYWDDERSAFIDSYTSGRRHITRHANIFAILYDFVDAETAQRISASVLHGDLADPITTPYFKLYELMALCRTGDMETTQDFIDSYWGGMVSLGATTVWEQFDPRKSGVEHYAMYGMPYGCSLCHAWGSGPIALLGKYCAGVVPTSVGYETFDVCPQPGRYGSFDAVVPVGSGTVSVHYKDGTVRASATVPGGTLRFGGKEAAIPTDGEAVLAGNI